MANGDYADIYAKFDALRGTYQELVDAVVDKLETELEARQIHSVVKGRVKDASSFATKALLRGYDDPLRQIGDKAGVRVTVVYADDIPKVERVVRELLSVQRCKSKLDALD